MTNEQKIAALNAMVEWLSDPEELGKKPYKIQLAGEFDLHDMHYYIFKFKKDLLGKWYVGVCGGYEDDALEHCGHIYSNMTEYNKNTAENECVTMVEEIREYWIKQAERYDKSPIQIAFEKNLKFISGETLDIEMVQKVFETDKRMRYFEFAECNFSSGRIIVADPLCYLQDPKSITMLEKKIPAGKYPLTLSIMDSEIAGRRIVGARLKVKNTEAKNYELASAIADEEGAIKNVFAGFPVEAGMACFCDQESAVSYWEFLTEWYAKNQDKNIYDDYFEELFAESYQEFPELQREGGDFLRWQNPKDNSEIVMFASGLGDGFYSDFLGLDEVGEICELVVLFMNPDLF